GAYYLVAIVLLVASLLRVQSPKSKVQSQAGQDLVAAEGERAAELVQGAEMAAAPVGAGVGVGAGPRIEAWQPDGGSASAEPAASRLVPGGGQLSAMPGMPGIAARPLPARSANGSRGIGEGRAGRG